MWKLYKTHREGTLLVAYPAVVCPWSWWAHRDDDNVLFIKFEDLKRDSVTTITKIATFMGYSHLSQEVINIIAEKTSFDKMRENDVVNHS